MSELFKQLLNINKHASVEKQQIVNDIYRHAVTSNYRIVEVNHQKPWGAYFRLHNSDIDRFIAEFFPDLNPIDARLGSDNLELSPKILLVAPDQKLSWQYHNRRAEMWLFLNEGAYCNSLTNQEGTINIARAGEIVKFANNERHRLISHANQYVLVAEIWQHTDSSNPSNEDDIVRLNDCYGREG